jgi:hypothetical protein
MRATQVGTTQVGKMLRENARFAKLIDFDQIAPQ